MAQFCWIIYIDATCISGKNYLFLWMYPCVLQLPECLRIIGYLRRIGVFSEYEMRLQVFVNAYNAIMLNVMLKT